MSREDACPFKCKMSSLGGVHCSFPQGGRPAERKRRGSQMSVDWRQQRGATGVMGARRLNCMVALAHVLGDGTASGELRAQEKACSAAYRHDF